MLNLQIGINKLVGSKLPKLLTEDGIIGKKTREGVEILRSEVEAIFKRKGYVWNKDGNLVAIRLKTERAYKFSNRFVDIGLVTLGQNEEAFQMSTVAGLYGRGNVLNPIWIDGVFGVGVVKEAQYRKAYELNGAWWTGRKFLKQIADFFFYRDGNLDLNLDRGKIYSGIRGFNFHTWLKFWGKLVNNLSQGCMVTEEWVWLNIVLPYLERLAVIYSNQIDFTLLNEDDFLL